MPGSIKEFSSGFENKFFSFFKSLKLLKKVSNDKDMGFSIIDIYKKVIEKEMGFPIIDIYKKITEIKMGFSINDLYNKFLRLKY